MSDNGCIAVQRSSILAVFLLGILLAVPLVGIAENQLAVNVETYKVSFTIEAANQTVSIPANGTVTIDVNIPSYLNASDVAAVHVVADNISGEIQLQAYSGNNTVATATIVPLGSGYHQTLPPTVDKIVLSSSAVANATIKVYLETSQAEFRIILNKTSISLAPGEQADIGITVEQLSGPKLYTWFTEQYTEPLQAEVYYKSGTILVPWDSQHAIVSQGQGWTKDGIARIIFREDGKVTSDVATVKLYLWADLNGVNPESAQLVAVVDLSGSITDTLASLSTSDNDKYISFGVGAIIAFIAAALVLGKGRGRRGQVNDKALVLLILVVLGAIGLSFGLFDVDMKFSLDPKFLGIGILAVLAVILLIKQGTVPAPKAVRKLFR